MSKFVFLYVCLLMCYAYGSVAETKYAKFPYISSGRKSLMGWDDKYLQELFSQSGNKTVFMKLVKAKFENFKELSKSTKLNNKVSGKVMLNQNASNSEPGRYFGKYLRPDHMTQQQIDKLVELHNTIRSSVSPTADEMLRLSWNYDLEASAASKAKSCAFRWSPTNSRLDNAGHGSGENVWVGWGVNFTTLDVNSPITTWFAEQKYFDPELQQCLGGSCEHYVQIIWHDVYRIGCAWNECNDIKVYGYPVNTAVFLVCHYGPRGARQPLFPYFRGVACSFCGQEDRCEYSLCTNDEREKTAGEKPWTDPPSTGVGVITTTEEPLISEGTKIGLIAGGSVLGATLLATAITAIVVRSLRKREQAAATVAGSSLNNVTSNLSEKLASSKTLQYE
uniref:peptidase inhibitor 16-like n=1 Tax=Ciona intestinalis TaxID=7719 RepID=UPI000EF4DCCA|nr:peptidase inhibitor 16-like [Ciona intestinalis]|eukprot:XP_002125330.4 peptidase inhibitor 16-like [Ciona intestinalis]